MKRRKIGKKEQLLVLVAEYIDLTRKINSAKEQRKELRKKDKIFGLRLWILLWTYNINMLENFRKITRVEMIELGSQIKRPGKRLRKLLPYLWQ